MVLKTTALDITGISPNDSAFFFRIYSMRNAMPAYRLEMVSDFGYSYEKGTSSSTTRTTRGVRSVTTQNGDDTKDLTFTTSETVSVEAHELLEWAFRNNELVEIWEVTPTVTADGLTILDNNGTPVPEGWMPDKYWVGRVNSDNYSNNAGDDNRTHEWGLSLEAMHDKSWLSLLNGSFPMQKRIQMLLLKSTQIQTTQRILFVISMLV